MNTPINSEYSAILTCHNAQETIERAISGILFQKLPPLELIIVDDFSSDDSVSKIEHMICAKEKIILIQNSSNMGQSWSRNHAVSLSKAKFAIIFDDDDFSLPNRAAEHMSMFSRGSTLNFVSSKKIYVNGHQIDLKNQDLLLKKLSAHDAMLNTLTGERLGGFGSVAIPASTSAFSIKEFWEVGGYDENFRRLEDAELFIRFSENGQSLAWSSEILVERFATQGNQKGGSIETTYELNILNKFRYLITPREYSFAKNLIEIRSSYFSKNYVTLFVQVALSPSKFWILVKKWKNAMRRILHDMEIGHKR